MNNLKKFKNHKVNELYDDSYKQRIGQEQNYNQEQAERKHKSDAFRSLIDKYNAILEIDPIKTYSDHSEKLDDGVTIKTIKSIANRWGVGIIDGVYIETGYGGWSATSKEFKDTTFLNYKMVDSEGFHTIIDMISDALNASDIDHSKNYAVIRNAITYLKPKVISSDIGKLEEGKFKKYFKHEKLNESSDSDSEPSVIQRQFNNGKYIKGYKSHSSAYGNSTSITDRFKLGDRVEVDLNEEKNGGKFGKIIPGFSKDNPDMLKIEFEDGSKASLVEKGFLQRVANEF